MRTPSYGVYLNSAAQVQLLAVNTRTRERTVLERMAPHWLYLSISAGLEVVE